jgi:8-oxo-dGTP pyrophosphatase MutT (NUDIX family)
MADQENKKLSESKKNDDDRFPQDCFTLPSVPPFGRQLRRFHSFSAPSPISFVINSMNHEAKRQRIAGSQQHEMYPIRRRQSSSSSSHSQHIFHEIEQQYKSAGVIPYVTNQDGTVSVLMQIGNGCGYDKNSNSSQTSVVVVDRSKDKITDFGGKRETNDISSIHCAVREFFEEVGQEVKPYFTERECIRHLIHLRDTHQLHYIFNQRGGFYVVYFLPVYQDPTHFNKFGTLKTRTVFPIRTSVYSYDDFDVQSEIIREEPEEGVKPIWIDTKELIEMIDKDYQCMHPRIRMTSLMKSILGKI